MLILTYSGDVNTIITLPGSKVIDLFENYVAKIRHGGGGGSGTGGWGMVSGEVRYTIDYTDYAVDPDGWGTLKDLTIHGVPVDTSRNYRFVTSNYLVEGGDGYAVLMDATNKIVTGVDFAISTIDYIYDQDAPLVPLLDGRVKLIGGAVLNILQMPE
jgi:5'-nucleotidase